MQRSSEVTLLHEYLSFAFADPWVFMEQDLLCKVSGSVADVMVYRQCSLMLLGDTTPDDTVL